MNHLKSLREFLSELEQHQELVRITREVDPNLEIGAICRRCYETGAPAPLFENIKGFAPGYRVLGAPGGTSSQPGLYLIHEESVNPLVAYLKPGEKMSFHTTKVIYNCLPPDLMTQLPKRSSFQGTYPVELQAHVLRSWKEYGF
jgi:UbiD family decarboxylase